MSAKEKAEELIEKYQLLEIHLPYEDYCIASGEMLYNSAKNCALIAVDEIIDLDNFSIEGREYWQQVKHEIQTFGTNSDGDK
jgi:hypothetical protein